MTPAPSRSSLAYLRAFALVLLLVLAQFGALAHALGHMKGGDGQGSVPETFCEWCGAYAQSGNAVPSAAAAPHFAAAFAAHEAFLPVTPLRQAVFFAYLSQAPPQFS